MRRFKRAMGMRSLWLLVLLASAGCRDAGRGTPNDASDPDDCVEPSSDPIACRPACCGCLCADPEWSCAADTCTNGEGKVVSLAPEAGFFELRLSTSRETAGPPADLTGPRAARARMWYSFYPADESAATKPLFVFIQGGPAGSVMPLWGTTAPLTLAGSADPTREGAQPNPHRWSALGNLLYIDSSFAGFSYEHTLEPGEQPCDSSFDGDEDAGQYTKVVLRFLARHPALLANPVVIVGESYGGVRATLMLQQLLHPESLRDPASTYQDEQLATDIDQHVTALADARNEQPAHSPELMARQFGRQVLIQPLVLGALQPVASHTLPVGCPREAVLPPPGFPAPELPQQPTTEEIAWQTLERMHQRLVGSDALSDFVGVDITSIEWLHATARAGACRRVAHEITDMLALTDTLGSLPAHDAYYVPIAVPLHFTGRGKLGEHPSSALAPLFIDNLRYVRTFVTNAQCDGVVSTEDLLNSLAHLAGVRSVARDMLGERAGEVRVELEDGTTAHVRIPFYARSGHVVTLHSPDAILEDVRGWLAQGE
jgi:Serine carboxypeptidase